MQARNPSSSTMSDPQTSTASDPFARNQANYASGDLVQFYAGGGKLKLAEEVILRRLRPRLQGGALLDIGVGGGRTTSHLLAISADYTGVDFSPLMVEACREKFPGATFQEADARNLEPLGRGRFDLVYFSFNGIDTIDGEGRARVLREAFAALKPGGLFLFSSHNLRVPPERPWHPSVYTWSLNPRTILYNLRHAWRCFLNYQKLAGEQSQGDDSSIVVDSENDFQMLHYYIEPARQVRDLTEVGFVEVEVFDQQGEAAALNAPALDKTGHVHYLARKPA
jgi:SAM-dependent methyltransferase